MTKKKTNQLSFVRQYDFSRTIKHAYFVPSQLALKHRQGRNHKLRIVVFVGSPIEIDEKEVSFTDFNPYIKAIKDKNC